MPKPLHVVLCWKESNPWCSWPELWHICIANIPGRLQFTRYSGLHAPHEQYIICRLDLRLCMSDLARVLQSAREPLDGKLTNSCLSLSLPACPSNLFFACTVCSKVASVARPRILRASSAERASGALSGLPLLLACKQGVFQL